MNEKTDATIKDGLDQILEHVEATGTIDVFDKKGELKFTRQITSIEVNNEDQNDAN